MSVYVDDMRARFGRMILCHMMADTPEELHAMADTIGVQRKWVQHDDRPADRHYDISITKRRLAVAAGAIEIPRREMSAFAWHRRTYGATIPPWDALKKMNHVFKLRARERREQEGAA